MKISFTGEHFKMDNLYLYSHLAYGGTSVIDYEEDRHIISSKEEYEVLIRSLQTKESKIKKVDGLTLEFSFIEDMESIQQGYIYPSVSFQTKSIKNKEIILTSEQQKCITDTFKLMKDAIAEVVTQFNLRTYF